MRRTLSIALCILMVVSLLCVGVSAADGTAISDAAGFAAMDPAGSYYLDADITIDTTFAAAFTGNFDGNGHTITTSVPLFAEVGGATIKNLTIAGTISVTGSSAYAAALALRVTKNTTTNFENIVNKANITGEYRTGGLVGQINCGASGSVTTKTTFTKCSNLANVSGSGMVGGLVGYSQGADDTFIDCVNKGSVTNASGCCGGIIGRTAGDYTDSGKSKTLGAQTLKATFTNCVNEGAIKGTTNVGGIVGLLRANTSTITGCINKGAITSEGGKSCDAGGIVGHAGSSAYFATVNVSKCDNYGAITQKRNAETPIDLTTLSADAPTDCAAGIVAYVYGSGDYGVGKISECNNYGDVNSCLFASQFFGYSNQVKTEIKNCKGLGKLIGHFKVIIGASSSGVSDETYTFPYGISGLQLAKGDATEYFTYACADANAGNRIKLEDYMAKCPDNIKYIEDEPVPPAPPSPSTGDSFVIYAVVAVVAVLGVAIVAKKKVND